MHRTFFLQIDLQISGVAQNYSTLKLIFFGYLSP